MQEKKIIVIVGATGAQGGSVIKHLLDADQFKLRAITRKPISPAAKDLSDKGVEVVAADLGNVESLKRAFANAWGVFGLTNYWEYSEKERQYGLNMINTAKECGVEFFVWSSVDHENKNSVSKDEITTHLKESGMAHAVFFPALYFENISNMWTTPIGNFKEISIPAPSDTPLLWFSVEDTGAYVSKAFMEPEKFNGQEIRAGTEWATPEQVVELLNADMGNYKLDQWDHKRLEDWKNQNALTNEIYSIMKFFTTHPKDDPIRKSFIIDVKLQSLKSYIARHHEVLKGAPRANLRTSSTYIPTVLRSSLEDLRIQPELKMSS